MLDQRLMGKRFAGAWPQVIENGTPLPAQSAQYMELRITSSS